MTDARRCIKCGRQVGPDESICDVCNRAGMETPSASQYHGTVAVAIIAAVAALAIAAGLSLRGVGPYRAEVTTVVPADPSGYAVTITVTNDGTASGRARCMIEALGPQGQRLATRSLLTVPVPGGGSVTATERIAALQVEPATVSAQCS